MNITIEEDIYNRLEPFKDSLNISKICENAIIIELKIKEINMEGSQMDTLIEKLKIQKQQMTKQSTSIGIEEGTQAAKDLDYSDFVLIAENQAITEEIEDWFRECYLENLSSDVDKESYEKGFVQGILEVWDKVREHI